MQRIVVSLVVLSLTLNVGCSKREAPAEEADQSVQSGPVAPVAATDLDPMIRELGPQGSVPQAIVVEMARPVVGADKVGSDAEGFEIVSDPPIDGRAVYTSPSTISFQPTTPLLPGVSYTVRLAQVPTENGPLVPPTTEAWKRQLTTPNFSFLRMSLVENEARLRQAVRQIQRCLREAESQYSGAAKGGLKEVAAEQTTITPH